MNGIRPETWDDYVGQEAMKDRLAVHISSALIREETLDHILLTGPPGCGKTSLASIIATEFGEPFTSFLMPIKEKALLLFLRQRHGVVLFDEIHRLSVKQQEALLPLVEDGYYQLDNGDRVYADNLTIIGATTEPEKIIPPLFDRFPIKPPFDDYTADEMRDIVHRMAYASGIELDDMQAAVLGSAAGGVPRNAKSLVFMARDLYHDTGEIDIAQVLSQSRVDENGLTEDHRRYCQVLAQSGGVAGLEILSAHLRLPKAVLVELERLLVKLEMVQYSKQGRELVNGGWTVAKGATDG